MRNANTLDIGRFNSVEPSVNVRVEPSFEPTFLKKKGTNEGRTHIGCRRIQFCRTNYERMRRAHISSNALKIGRNSPGTQMHWMSEDSVL